jgi:signal peptidase
LKKFLRHALLPLLTLLVVGTIVAFGSVYTIVRIETGSMEPNLPVGTIAFIKQVDTLEPTDIITFRQPTDARPITHTFIGYTDDGSLRTKGDANQTPDEHSVPLQMSDVMGKVMFSIPFFSVGYWSSAKGVLSLVWLGMISLIMLVVLVRTKSESRKEEPVSTREPSLESNPV